MRTSYTDKLHLSTYCLLTHPREQTSVRWGMKSRKVWLRRNKELLIRDVDPRYPMSSCTCQQAVFLEPSNRRCTCVQRLVARRIERSINRGYGIASGPVELVEPYGVQLSNIEWYGHRQDMPSWIFQARLVPSMRWRVLFVALRTEALFFCFTLNK